MLDNAEKRLHKEIELVEYLRSKIVDSVKTTKYNFVPYSEARKAIVVEPPFTEQEKEQLRQEVDELVNKDYDEL